MLLQNALYYGLIGCGIFFLLLIIVDRTQVFKAVRDEEGHFRKKFNATAIIGLSMFMTYFVGLLIWSCVGLQSVIDTPSFWQLWGNAFLTFFVVHLFDLLVIDLLLVVYWHPAFLKLPDTDYYTKAYPHIQGFFRGIPFGGLVSLGVAVGFVL